MESLPPGDDAALVYAPGFATEREQVCGSLLASADHALAVSVRRPPSEWLDDREAASLPPTRLVAADDHPDCVRTVSNPGDLTGFGIAVSRYLDELPDDATPGVCLDSVTTLLQYVDENRAHRFLQVLVNRVRSADGHVHCHADPAAHDDRVCEALDSLFDAKVSVGDARTF